MGTTGRFGRALRAALVGSTALAGIVVATISPASAADFAVNSEASLRTALTNAQNGDSITFTSNVTVTTAGGGDLPAITRNLTINGNGFALDGSNANRGFLAYSGTTTISNLTIQNTLARGGSSGYGGGGMGAGGGLFVASAASVTLTDVLFSGTAANGGASTSAFGNRTGGGGLGGDGGQGNVVGGGGGGVGSGASGGSTSGASGSTGTLTGAAGGGSAGGAGGGPGGTNGGGGGTNAGQLGGGGGGGVGGGNGSSDGPGQTGGNGGFGGGGGSGSSNGSANGGAGGFGGGGGFARGSGGAGGFGGGGGSANTAGGFGGFGGGNGDIASSAVRGGGGAGFGGAVFVQEGGVLTVAGGGSQSGGTVVGGAGSQTGQAAGTGYFLQGTGTLAFSPGAGQTQTVAGAIEDQIGFVGRTGYVPPAGTYAGTESWAVTKTDSGTLVLSGANSYSGGTVLAGGTTSVSSDANLGAPSGGLTFDGGTLQVTGTTFTTTARTVTLNGGGGTVEVVDAATSLTMSGPIGGAGSLTKAGPGSLVLSGSNGYTGGTYLYAGTLVAGSNSAFGSGPVYAYAGTIGIQNGFTVSNTISIGGTISLDVASGATGTYAGSIDNSLGDPSFVVKTGGGTLVLTNTNAPDLGFILRQGTVQTGIDGALGNAEITFDGGTLRATGALALTNRGIFLDAGGGTVDTGVYQVTLAGGIQESGGPGPLVKAGSGTLLIQGTSAYTGPTNVQGGTFQGGIAGAFSASSAYTVDAPAVLDIGGFDQTVGSLAGAGTVRNSGGAAAALTVGGLGTSTTFSGLIEDGGPPLALSKIGTGTLTLSGANTYTGGTTISAGILEAAHVNLGTEVIDALGTGPIRLGGGTLRTTGTGGFTNDLTFAGGQTSTLTAADGTTLAVGGTATTANQGTFTAEANAVMQFGIAGGTGVIEFGRTSGVTIDPTARVVVAGGTLRDFQAQLTNLTGFAASTTVNAGATLDFNDTLAPQVINNLQGAGTVRTGATPSANPIQDLQLGLTNGATVVWSGDITGARGVFMAAFGSATMVFDGTNTYTGNTAICACTTLQLGSGGTTGSIDPTGTVLNGGTLAFNRSNTYTFANVIADDPSQAGTQGAVVQMGSGTTILTATNTYSGGTTIAAGTLQIGAGGTSGSILGNVADNGTLAFNRSDAVTFPGIVSGAGSLVQLGTGILTLSAANTYSGGTTITAGTLVGSATSFGTGPITDNAALVINQPTNATLANAISGTGSVAKQGVGALILSGQNTYSGGTTIAAGTLVGSATSFGSGPIANSAALVINQPTTATFANAMSGTGSLMKQGAGLLDLTGSSTLSGPTTIAAGTLAVNGSLANSTVTVGSGATLGGNGIVGGIVAGAGSAVAPGNSIGQLNVAGNVAFAAGSTFQVEVNAAGQGDRVAATGSATLSGGTVQVLAAQGNYAAQTRYTILSAAGGVAGRFADVTSNLAFLMPSLAYDAANVVLTLSRAMMVDPVTGGSAPVAFSSVAQTRNQVSVANAVQSLGIGNPIFDAVLSRSAPEARLAFDRLSNEVSASTVTASFEVAGIVREAILGRLRGMGASGFGLPTAAASVDAAYAADLPGGRRPETSPVPVRILDPRVFALWGQGFGSFGATGSDGNAGRLTRQTGGFVIGADATLDGTTRFGLAGGYTTTSVDVRSRLSSGEIRSGFGALYAGTSLGPVSLRLGGVYADTWAETRRTILFPGFSNAVQGRFGGSVGQVFGEAGYKVPLGTVTLEPFAGLAGVFIARDRYTETGGAGATTVFGRGYDVGVLTAGLRAEAALSADWPLHLRGLIGYRHAFGDVVPRALVAFAGTAATFGVAGVPIDRNAVVAEAGLDWRVTDDVTIGLAYAGQAGARAYDHGVKGSFLWKF